MVAECEVLLYTTWPGEEVGPNHPVGSDVHLMIVFQDLIDLFSLSVVSGW